MPAAALALVIASGGGAGVALTHADTVPRQLPPEASVPAPVAPTAPAAPMSPDVPGDQPTAGTAPEPAAASAPRGNRSNLTAAAALHDGEDVDVIPTPALAAYQRTEAIIGAAAPDCHLDWTVIAAVGQVLTDHGRRDEEHTLDDNGAVTPPILGPVIRDVRGKRLADSDAGDLDGDGRRDRAVGPMLLAPAAWRDVGVDGDSDGSRDPQDIDDAALAAAVLLCAHGDDLRRPRQLAKALERMNARPEFAPSVSDVATAYEDDVATSDPVPTFTAASIVLTREADATPPPPPDHGGGPEKTGKGKGKGNGGGPDQPKKAGKYKKAEPITHLAEPEKDEKAKGKGKSKTKPKSQGKDQGKGNGATEKNGADPSITKETEGAEEAEEAEETTPEPPPESEPAPEPDPEPEAVETTEPEATEPTEDEATTTCDESTEPEDAAAPKCDGTTTSSGA